MAKSEPIGVRFDRELLDSLIASEIITSPQKALNLYEKVFKEYEKNKNSPLLIQTTTNVLTAPANYFHKPVSVENEPKENTNRFFLKYGFFTYAEISQTNKK